MAGGVVREGHGPGAIAVAVGGLAAEADVAAGSDFFAEAAQVSGVVRGVDTRNQQIGLQLSNGQTVGVQYDNNTQVIYNNQRYNITSPGDLRDAARLLDVATTTVASRRQ